MTRIDQVMVKVTATHFTAHLSVSNHIIFGASYTAGENPFVYDVELNGCFIAIVSIILQFICCFTDDRYCSDESVCFTRRT